MPYLFYSIDEHDFLFLNFFRLSFSLLSMLWKNPREIQRKLLYFRIHLHKHQHYRNGAHTPYIIKDSRQDTQRKLIQTKASKSRLSNRIRQRRHHHHATPPKNIQRKSFFENFIYKENNFSKNVENIQFSFVLPLYVYKYTIFFWSIDSIVAVATREQPHKPSSERI